MTNFENAVALLKQVKTVKEWNEVRASIKDTLTIAELYRIDSSGLITEVLGADKYVTY